MKNIRRLMIVMTLAVMAMIMMTGAAFAETKITAEGEDYSFQSATATVWGCPTSYVILDKEPSTLIVTSTDYDRMMTPSDWENHPLPFDDKEWFFDNCQVNHQDSDYSGVVQELNIGTSDSLYEFDSPDESYVFLVVIKAKPPTEAVIDVCEQLSDDTVSIGFIGNELDFTNNFKTNWFTATLKSSDGEAIPVKVSTEVIDATHIKYTYDVDHSYENKLGKEKGTAKLTVSYEGATESKTFDVTLPASSYWSRYAEEPQKIAKGDKDWPEFVGYYKISTPEELAWFAGLVNGELEGVTQDYQAKAFLSDDIECNDTDGWEDWDINTTGVKFWDCTIGKAPTTNYESAGGRTGVSFRGIFDGNGHSISGLYILPDPTVNHYEYIMDIALFPLIYNAEIRNLGVEDSYICSYPGSWSGSRAAGIVSNAQYSEIENCWFSGHVSGQGYSNKNLGGIVAQAVGTPVRACYSDGIIDCSASQGGSFGAIAYEAFQIEGCYSIGSEQGFGIATRGQAYSCYSDTQKRFSGDDTVVRDSYRIEGSVDYANAEALTEEQFKDGTLLEGLDPEYFCADDKGDAEKNNGYPILFWQSDLYQVKKAAIKEVKYMLDPEDYVLSRKELEQAIETAVSTIEMANDEASITSIKSDVLQVLKEFKTDAELLQENDDAVKELKKKLKEIQAKIELQGAEIKLAKKAVVFNGKAQKPAVTVTGRSGAVLKEDSDYTVEYKANIKPGIATVTVTGVGSASSEVNSATFKILPKKAVLKKVKPAKKKLTISWAKDTTVTGYEVQYSLKKTFKSAKTLKITKAKTTKKLVKKLKSGKKYFVRIRSYKKAGKTTLYGAWSKAKNAKVK